jgi:glycerol-3-phosphate dehydrogenase
MKEGMSEAPAIQRGGEHTDVDVVVIGGGVNGSGVARDCTQRGLRVAVFERNDVAFGASGNNSGMIHGGPRYLTYDPDVTYTSCLDSGHIQRIAPHLLFRIPFLMPVHRDRRGAKVALTLLDAFFDLYDKYQPLKRGKPHTVLTAEQLQQLEPGLAGMTVGGVSFDEWGIDGVRLCVGNLVDAAEGGASVRIHTTVTDILRREDGAVRGVRYRDLLTGESGTLTAPVVVNATGAWAPLTATLSGLLPEHARIRPGKGIHVFFDRRLTNYAIAVRAIDGRQVFLEPWQNMSVIGTTDTDYYGDLDDVVATTAEVRYLIQAVARVFPAITDARPIGTWAGVRPTLYAWGPNPDGLSREHEIIDHARHGAPGLFSMVGGKLASYRLFSEEMTDAVAQRFGIAQRSRTHLLALPGGEELLDPLALADDAGIEPIAGARLEYRHGARALRVIDRLMRHRREAAVLCPCEPVLEAEVRYVVENEWAQTVDDVSRRTRLGLGACGGMRCAARCGAIVAEMTGRSPLDGQRMALDFLESAARRRLSVVGPTQARQEALSLAAIRSQLGSTRTVERPPGDLGPTGLGPRTTVGSLAQNGAQNGTQDRGAAE